MKKLMRICWAHKAPCTPVSEENTLNSVLGRRFSSPFLSACCPRECPEPCRVDGPGPYDDTDMVMLGDPSIFAKSKTSEEQRGRGSEQTPVSPALPSPHLPLPSSWSSSGSAETSVLTG